GLLIWPAMQIRRFAWSAWWMIGVVALLVVAHLRDRTSIARLPVLRRLAVVPAVLAVKYLLLDALAFRVFHNPAPATVIANAQTFAAACLFAGLFLVRYLLGDADVKDAAPALSKIRTACGAAAMIMLLC